MVNSYIGLLFSYIILILYYLNISGRIVYLDADKLYNIKTCLNSILLDFYYSFTNDFTSEVSQIHFIKSCLILCLD